MKHLFLLLFISSAFAESITDREFGPKDDPRGWKLYEAIRDDDVQSVKALVEDGVSVKSEPTKRNGYVIGIYPICTAAKYGRTAIAAFLLSNGADPNSAAPSGESALWSAAYGGHLEMVKLLLKSGARANGSSELTRTPTDVLNDRIKHFESIKSILAESGGMPYREMVKAEQDAAANP